MDKLYVIFMTIKKMPIGRKHSAAKIHDNPPILVYTDYMGLVLLFCDTKAGLCPLGRGFSRAGKRCKNRDSADRQPVFSKEKIHQ